MSRDRTLLANLAFADPDKKDPLHDLGCQYIARPEVSALLGLGQLQPKIVSNRFADRDWSNRQPQFEVPISKGDGQYKTTIGFLDVMLPMAYSCSKEFYESGSSGLPANSTTVMSEDVAYYLLTTVFVEVKITPVSLGDMLRQINLYNEYMRPTAWVLAAAFEMSSATVDALHAHGILPVHLGKGFREWAAAQQALPRSTSVLSL